MGKKGAQVRSKLTASPTNASSDGEVHFSAKDPASLISVSEGP